MTADGAKPETSALVQRSAMNFVGLAVANALQFVLVLMIGRSLDQHAAGVFFEGFAAVRLLSVLAVLGLDVTAVRYVSTHRARGEHEHARGAVMLSVLLAGAASIAITIVVFLLAPQLSDLFGAHDLQYVLRVMVLALPAITLQMVLIGATRGTGRMKAFVVVDQTADGVLRVGAVAIALAAGYGLDGVAVAFTIASYLTVAAAAMAARRITGTIRQAFSVDSNELIRFSANQWGASLAGVGLLWADTLLLGLWRPPADVAVYSIATRTVLFGMMFILPIGIAFQPQIGRLYALSDHVGLARMYGFATKWSTIAGCPPLLFLALFAAPIVTLLYGGSYARGAWPLALLAIGQTVNAATGPCGHVVTMIGRSDLVLKNSLAALVLNVVLNVALIPPYGMVGAGLAWGVSIIVWNMIRLWQVYDVLSMQPFGAWSRPVGVALLVFVGASGGLRLALDSTPAVVAILVGAAGATIAYAVALVATSAFDDEDRFVLGPLARLSRTAGRTRPSS
jgi:O-antigen/teichoic acid export membrane protein